jgi:D-3-phosphoglycerate dehydrogenase / 2-oxoglutarate reductase
MERTDSVRSSLSSKGASAVDHETRVVYLDGKSGGGAIEREALASRGYELELAACKSDDDAAEAAAGAAAILVGLFKVGESLLAKLPDLRVVARGGVGVDNIDLDAATRAGVIVCNVPDYCIDEVANHAFAMLLALNRKLIPLDRGVRSGTRPSLAAMAHTGPLAGETLGLVSFGNIAKAVARRASGFNMRVLAYDPYVDPADAKAAGADLVSLEELLAQSDYVSVHTPLSAATRGLVGPAELALMKPSAYLVLTSRGGVVDEVALAEAIRDQRIAGAGLDVWEQEPPAPDNPLLTLDNVVTSMHIASYSEASELLRRRRHAEATADVLDGITPRSVVNPEVLERFALSPRSNS